MSDFKVCVGHRKESSAKSQVQFNQYIHWQSGQAFPFHTPQTLKMGSSDFYNECSLKRKQHTDKMTRGRGRRERSCLELSKY